MYAIGQMLRLQGTVRDTDGNLFDPPPVKFNITTPAGVTSVFDAVNDGVGLYHYEYTPADAGNYAWWFSGTGTVQPADIFTVIPAASSALVSLADVKAQLNKTGAAPFDAANTDDDELWRFIQAATEIINFECGYTAPTPFAETVNLGRADYTTARFFTLTRTPVLSITSVLPQLAGAPPVIVPNLVLDSESGVVYPAINTVQAFYGPMTVHYLAGRGFVPPALQSACLLIVQDMWQSQRGGATGVPGQDVDESGPESYGIPNRALQLMKMAPYSSGPSVA